MEREDPPPMTTDAVREPKKSIFDEDDEDDDLFKSAIDSKMGGGSELAAADPKTEDDTSGYLTTAEVNRSNTLDDIGDSELFKSALEPEASNRINGATFSGLEKEEEINLEDEDEPHLAYPGPHARGQVT